MVASVTTNLSNNLNTTSVSPTVSAPNTTGQNSAVNRQAASATQTGLNKISPEVDRYTAVQQDLSKAKSAVSSASTANDKIDDSLKQVKAIAGKLADSNVVGEERKKLQEQYKNIRNNIMSTQEKASVGSGDQKINLLRDAKDLTVASNTRGGELKVASNQNAKALGLPENLDSAEKAQALLSGDEKQAGSLANAQKTTENNRSRLSVTAADLDKRLETSNAVAKAVQRLEDAKNGGSGLSAEREAQRNKALEQAKSASEQIRAQLSGFSGNRSSNNNPLLALFN